MQNCSCENWTLRELAHAMQDKLTDKRIVVPMFQRGQRWRKEQETTFIDSLKKGYPVGTMLFYETYENSKKTYILVDGLQRGNCIKKYIMDPMQFIDEDSIPNELCEKISSLLEIEIEIDTSVSRIKSILTSFIKQQSILDNVQFYTPANIILKEFQIDFSQSFELISKIISLITNYYSDFSELYKQIASAVIPVVVYRGGADSLPEVFERINSKGTPLDQYEIYAASWPITRNCKIDNSNIIEAVIRKYDSLTDNDFLLQDYNKEMMRTEKIVNVFEYVFGLGKYLVNKFPILSFGKSNADDTVNSLSFELLNACFNDSNKIMILYKNLECIDINKFEKALYEVIEFVSSSIATVTNFKGNSRGEKKPFHSKYQIMSMIAFCFKKMYQNLNFDKKSDNWKEIQTALSRNLLHYYIYDIITNYWSEGGTAKIYIVSKNNRYMTEISSRSWAIALDSYFEKSMQRKEIKKIAVPSNEEYVILNCIHAKTFTAMDQLSLESFDVEHIAPKEQMKKLNDRCNGDGLPISCIANLCYLPQYVNRSKSDKTFYQDTKYRSYIELEEIEKKYSFTKESDLDWLNCSYDTVESFSILKANYFDFCGKRFELLKKMFCESLGVDNVVIDRNPQEIISSIAESNAPTMRETSRTSNRIFSVQDVSRLEKHFDVKLIRNGKKTFITADNQIGLVITCSKIETFVNKERFWFSYRRKVLDKIKNCHNQYYAFVCGDERMIILLPLSEIENRLDEMSCSTKDGEITHWHVVFYRLNDGKIMWWFPNPQNHKVPVNQFVLNDNN